MGDRLRPLIRAATRSDVLAKPAARSTTSRCVSATLTAPCEHYRSDPSSFTIRLANVGYNSVTADERRSAR